MQCQECGQRPATVHFTKIVNGYKNEMHLCEQCARQKGDLGFAMEANAPFQNLLSSLFETSGMTDPYQVTKGKSCPNCGLTYDDFRRIGQLGCSECYNTFERELDPILRRLHGSTSHAGKMPAKGADGRADLRKQIEELRKRQVTAIRKEDYESAARLRDEIRGLEAQMQQSGGASGVNG